MSLEDELDESGVDGEAAPAFSQTLTSTPADGKAAAAFSQPPTPTPAGGETAAAPAAAFSQPPIYTPVEQEAPATQPAALPGIAVDEAPATPGRPQTQESGTQPTQSSDGSSSRPALTDNLFGFCFKDNERRSKKSRVSFPDPMVQHDRTIRFATTPTEVHVAIHQSQLFDGFRNPDEAFPSVTAFLEQIVQEDARSHRALSEDMDFALRMIMPEPFADAINAVGRGNGRHPESLLEEDPPDGSE